MRPILLISLLAILALLVLSLRFPVVASLSKALCRWLAHPLTFLAVAALKTAAWCLGVYNRCLARPVSPQGMQSAEKANPAIVLLFRVFIFLCSVCIYLGDLQLAMYRSASFFNLRSPVLRVLPPEVFAAGAGAMWICMATLYGIMLCEAAGIMPKGVHLFRVTTNWKRGILGVFSFICFLASSMLTALFYTYGQQEILHLSPSPDLALLITLGFGFFICIVSVIAAWALVLGGVGVICLVAGALSCAFVVLGYALFLAGKVIKDFGSIVPSTDLEPAAPRHASDTTSRDTSDDPVTSASIPTPAAVQVHEEKELVKMKDTKKTICIIGYGPIGTRIIPLFVQAAQEVGAISNLLAYGLVDLASPYRRSPVPSQLRGVRNFTPTVSEILNANPTETGKEAAYGAIAEIMNNRVVAAYTDKYILTGVIVLALPLSLIPQIAPALRSLNNRLSRHTLILIIERPAFDNTDAVTKSWEELRTLRKEHIIANAFLLDATADKATQMGAEAYERACAQTLMGLCIAPNYYAQNPTIVEVAEGLGDCEPLTGMSCQVLGVVSGPPRPLWPLLKRFIPAAGEKGRGNYEDVFKQAKAGTQEVAKDCDKAKPCFVAYSLPFHPSDSRFKRFARDVRANCLNIVRTMHPILISANGTHVPGEAMGYRVQVTCLYPLKELDFAALPASQSVEKADGHLQHLTAQDVK